MAGGISKSILTTCIVISIIAASLTSVVVFSLKRAGIPQEMQALQEPQEPEKAEGLWQEPRRDLGSQDQCKLGEPQGQRSNFTTEDLAGLAPAPTRYSGWTHAYATPDGVENVTIEP